MTVAVCLAVGLNTSALRDDCTDMTEKLRPDCGGLQENGATGPLCAVARELQTVWESERAVHSIALLLHCATETVRT